MIPAQIQDKQMLWNGFKDTSKAAVQHGLHSQIISFTDMHEWTKCASMCAWLSLCVRKDLFASLESFYNMEAAAVPYSFLRKQPPCIRLIYTCLSIEWLFPPTSSSLLLSFLGDSHILNSLCMKNLIVQLLGAFHIPNRCRDVTQTEDISWITSLIQSYHI